MPNGVSNAEGAGQQQEDTPQQCGFDAGGGQDHRFGGQRAGQRQPEGETAMQVGPERHHRDQPERWRAIFFTRRHQSRRPDRQQRQRQHMRPRQQTAGDASQAQHHRDQRGDQIDPLSHGMGGDESGQPRSKGEQQMHAWPPRPPAERHRDLGQPFLGVPGRTGHGVGKGIGAQHPAVRQHPFPGADVPIGVAVVQQPGRKGRQHTRRHGSEQREDQGGGGRAGHQIGFRIGAHSIRATLTPPFQSNALVSLQK
jgi:hypothetical protein